MIPLKTLYKRAINSLNRDRIEKIFFLHVPKCGGTSIDYAIKSNFYTLDFRKDHNLVHLSPEGSVNAANIIENKNFPNDTANDYHVLKLAETLLLYYMIQDNHRYISGHFSFSELAYQKFNKKFAFITILRDPIKRWISVYFFNKYKNSKHCGIEEDFLEYLESDRAKAEGIIYAKFLGGADITSDYTTQQAIDRAKKNLHKFEIVGCLENLDIFSKHFERRFGFKLNIPQKNRNPKSHSYQKSIITEEIQEKIKTLCKPDLEIYQYALDNIIQSNN